VQPRDPSSVDADEIDLRARESDPVAARSAAGAVGEGDETDGDEESNEPENPFSLESVSASRAEPTSDGTIRRRRDVGDTRPLGPGPLPGPVAGEDGSLDLTEVGPVGEDTGPGFLPAESRRRGFESVFVRLVATAGVVGIATAVGAAMGAAGVATWVVALVVSLLSVALAAVLWRSRRL